MKKLFFTLCALCLCGTMWGQTQDTQYSLYYTVADGEATIVAPTDGSKYTIANLEQIEEGKYSIPETVDSYTVVGIDNAAFSGALTDTGNLIHLVIPANVVSFNGYGFQNCTQIQEVTVEAGGSGSVLRENNGTSYDQAFSGCTNLKTVYDYRDITHGRGSTGSEAYRVHPFCGVPSIETVYIGEEVTQLTNNAFNALSSGNLAEVYCYATNPPSLANYCFEYKKEGCILYVHEYALGNYNTNDTWVDIFGYDNIKAMTETDEQPEGTLRDVTTGLYFEINEGVVSIVADASGVYTDSNLVKNDDGSYTLPSYVEDKSGEGGYVTRVDASAFEGSSISGHLVIPATITKLGSKAFYNCTGLTEVTLEYSETALAEENNQLYTTSFYSCSNLQTVHMNREVTIARGDSDNNHAYRISPFSDLTSIETIYIGENVTSIPYNMFNCNNTASCKLSMVYCYATTVPTLAYQAFGTHTGLTLYVYDEVVDDFKNDTQTYSWPSFFSTINGMGSTPLEEGTYKDLTTGLYFELNEDGTASIYHDEAGVYTDENLVAHETIANAYTLPATVQAEEDGTVYNVTRVEANAFANSSISGHLVIPAHITAIGEAAFDTCTGLTEVTFEYSSTALLDENAYNNSSDHRQSFRDCTGIETVNLYRHINLGHGSGYLCGPFVWQNSIKTVNIGPRVDEIPAYMFRDHNSSSTQRIISTINCYALTPPTTTYDPFGDVVDGCVVNVPVGLVDTYTSAAYSETSVGEGTTWGSYFGTGNIKEMTDAFAITTNDGADGAYATFYNSASAVEFFNAEATVYAATSVEIEEEVGTVYIEDLGSVVPNATAVLVETSEAQTMLAIATSEDVTAPTTNYLYGYDTATPITEPAGYVYYMLTYGADGGSLGFYWGATDGAAFESAAHKAYLAIPSDIANKASGISIKKDAGGDTTGISSVEANDGAKVSGIYTIQGVRVSDMSQPGIYIVDGRKILVK